MSASVIGSNSQSPSTSHYGFSVKRSSEAHRGDVSFDSRNRVDEKSTVDKKREGSSSNCFLVKAVDNNEENRSWINATRCGGPRWKGREAVFKVIAELAQEIAKRDGEIETLRERAAEQDKLIRELLSISRSHMQLRFNFMKFAKYFLTFYANKEIESILCEQLEFFKKQEEDEAFCSVFSNELAKWSYRDIFPTGHAVDELVTVSKEGPRTPSKGSWQLPSTSYSQQDEAVHNQAEALVVTHDLSSKLSLDASDVQRNGFLQRSAKASASHFSGSRCSSLATQMIKNDGFTKVEPKPVMRQNEQMRLRQKDELPSFKASSSNIVSYEMQHSKAHGAKTSSVERTVRGFGNRLSLTEPQFARSMSADDLVEQFPKDLSSEANYRNNKTPKFLRDSAMGMHLVTNTKSLSFSGRIFIKPNIFSGPKLTNVSSIAMNHQTVSSDPKSSNDSAKQNGVVPHVTGSTKRSIRSVESNPPPKLFRKFSEEDVIVLSSDEDN